MNAKQLAVMRAERAVADAEAKRNGWRREVNMSCAFEFEIIRDGGIEVGTKLNPTPHEIARFCGVTIEGFEKQKAAGSLEGKPLDFSANSSGEPFPDGPSRGGSATPYGDDPPRKFPSGPGPGNTVKRQKSPFKSSDEEARKLGLSDDEIRVCRMTGVDPADYARTKSGKVADPAADEDPDDDEVTGVDGLRHRVKLPQHCILPGRRIAV
jgi:hypothetical protein